MMSYLSYKLTCKSSEMIKNVDGLKGRFARVLSRLKVVFFLRQNFWMDVLSGAQHRIILFSCSNLELSESVCLKIFRCLTTS